MRQARCTTAAHVSRAGSSSSTLMSAVTHVTLGRATSGHASRDADDGGDGRVGRECLDHGRPDVPGRSDDSDAHAVAMSAGPPPETRDARRGRRTARAPAVEQRTVAFPDPAPGHAGPWLRRRKAACRRSIRSGSPDASPRWSRARRRPAWGPGSGQVSPGARRSSPAATAASAGRSRSAFAREGADVAIVYLNEHDDAARRERLVEAEGRRALAHRRRHRRRERSASDAVEARRRASSARSTCWSTTPPSSTRSEELEDITAGAARAHLPHQHLRVFFLTKAALPHLQASGRRDHQHDVGHRLPGQPEAARLLAPPRARSSRSRARWRSSSPSDGHPRQRRRARARSGRR